MDIGILKDLNFKIIDLKKNKVNGSNENRYKGNVSSFKILTVNLIR